MKFSFIARYLELFKKIYKGDSEEAENPNNDLNSYQKVPPMSRVYGLAHNLVRFQMHPSPATKKEIEDFVALLAYIGDIYFKLPKLFFRFPKSFDGEGEDLEDQGRLFEKKETAK